MIKIVMKDDSVEILRDEYDFIDLVEEHMGLDCSKQVSEFIDNGNYNIKKLDTDLDSYLESLNEMSGALSDIKEHVNDLKYSLISGDRMNRAKIIAVLEIVTGIVDNTI